MGQLEIRCFNALLKGQYQALETARRQLDRELKKLQRDCQHPNLNIAWKAGSRLLRCQDCGLRQEEPIQVEPLRFAVGDRVRFNPLLGPKSFTDRFGQDWLRVIRVEDIDGQPDWQWVTIAGPDSQQTFNCLWLIPA
jgi:hypothetical protein